MKLLIIIATVAFGEFAMAHYECNGICKYTYYDLLRSAVVSGTGTSQEEAASNMRKDCSNQCSSSILKGCSVINYSCTTPSHMNYLDSTFQEENESASQ